ncbi:lysosomal alpha-glucosidase [Clarias gariepinus]|uniref:lysosomal alpha-glucosidase n=1 Tax=Clarias gariepinus TaxID=13013 RepID=UPI00234C9DE9|nr:lysosomal alpha-glucosidase [Clarias gariepinus]XP_053333227.1 lysosomal alpha-glucosidase [Clarias gariepinus]
MVSYKRLTPEEVNFSGVPLLQSHDDSQDGDPKPEDAERPLLARRRQCSVTAALVILGGFVLVVLGVWLLGAVLRVCTTSSIGVHRPPSPVAPPGKGNRTKPESCAVVPESWRFDCYPERGVVVTEEMCHARNCCFIRPAEEKNGVPWCYYPPEFPSYALVGLNETETGLSGTLVRNQKTYYPKDIETLRLDVLYESNSRLRVKITDPSQQRFEVPIDVPGETPRAQNPLYTVEFSKQPFGIVVKRTQNGAVLLNTTVAPLFYADQFLQMSTSLTSSFLYGLGEHRSSLMHDTRWSTFTMWARDAAPEELINLYGAHPFYLLMESDGLAHGSFLLNSNAMDVVLQPAPALTWRTIGGVLDLYVFLGPDPGSVVSEYLEVVGRPAMPVYWALGYHLCRWGYGSSNKTWDVVREMRNYGIPQEVQWNDIDYMDRSLDFTFDPEGFSTLPDLVRDLHLHSQRYVLILDPGISSVQPPGTYAPYEEGIKGGVFINTSSGETLIGKVWPGLTAFPDFSNPDTHEWWYRNLQQLHGRVSFDGLWIDMNEPSNFFDGSADGCPDTELENPPYTPYVLGGSLRAKTVCASARQRNSSHYNLHNLYGLMEAEATASALRRILSKRPFVISRSTFPSQGKYSGHWLGDNRSQWKDLYMSISGMLTFNLLGVPLVGADICGFSQNTTEELCVRWTQLGAFYPFTRNHNTKDSVPQDPTVFSRAAREAMKEALLLRYSLFPFLYTLFHYAHVYGHTVARPLFFEFPTDGKTYAVDKQFLLGKSVLVTPVLEVGVEEVVGYVPQGLWYDFYTGDSFLSKGEEIKLHAPLDKINLHLREGSIIPTQRPNTTLWVSRTQPLHLVVCVSQDGQADGELFWDDGESLDTYEKDEYAYVLFSLKQNTMTSEVVRSHVEATYLTVETVSFYGVRAEPKSVTVNTQEVPFSYTKQVLRVDELGLNLAQNFTISWK